MSEAQQLEQLPSIAAAGKVRVIPWVVPSARVQTPFADRSGVAFVGSFAHAPNVDAARWLVGEIMPRVWREAPEVRCLIIGSDLSDELRSELAVLGVDVLGRVDRLDDVFERIRCSVAPLRFGAGLKDKVLRSMAAGLPCVGTPEAFRGMPSLPAAITSMCHGETAAELAAAIVRMHRDGTVNAGCAQAGLIYVSEFYNQCRVDTDPRHGQSGIRAASGEDEGTIDWHGPGICCKAAGRKTRRRYRSGKSGEALDLQLMSTIPLLAALRGSAVSIDGTQPKYSPGYWAARFREQ